MEKTSLNKENLLKSYRDMLLIRRFEEKSGQLYTMGYINGFCHLYIGQEAIVVGLQNLTIPGDYTITSYRCHGHILAAGTDPRIVMAELFGRSSGCSGGKGGSMHLFDKERGFFGGHGIVGAQVSLGTGIGFACKYRKNNNLCLTYFGDGAINQGQVYESFNLASLWKLPVVYIIENNEYSMGTSVARSSAGGELYKRGESFGIKGMQINGMDLFEVQQKSQEALDHVRKNNEPIILEMKTYRYRGHSVSDPAKYRTKEEVENYKENHDPINNLRKILLEKNGFSEEDLKKTELEIKKLVEEAVEFSQKDLEPDPDQLFSNIYR